MKQIISRRTGNKLNIVDAEILSQKLKNEFGISTYTHPCTYGYPTPEIAIRATQAAVIDSYSANFTFIFLGTVFKAFEGYKVHAVYAKLPENFETLCHDYVVIGE